MIVNSEKKSGSYNWQKQTGSHEHGGLKRRTNHTSGFFSWSIQ